MPDQPIPNAPSPASSPRRRGLGRWVKALAMTGGLLTLGGLIAGGWGYALVRRELPIFLQDNLSAALGRPIKVGKFQRLGLTGVRLGPSILPPTEDNFSWVRASALEVNFNPLELLLTRTLRPSVVFIEPQMAIKQGFDGDWRVLAPGSVGQRGWIKTELRGLQIRNADLAIGPISRSSIVELPEGVTSATLVFLENVNLRVRFSGADNKTASLVVGGRLNSGSFQIRGEGRLDTHRTNLAVQAQQIPIETVNPLLGGDWFVRDGMVSANLDLKFRPQTAEPLTVTGTARLRNGDIIITDLPSPLQAINGTLIATGVGGRLENSSLKFGPILAKAAGTIDRRQGHHLAITLPDFSLEQLTTALAQTLPIEAQGRFRVTTQITGPWLQPQATGRLENLGQVQVDRLGLDRLTAQFAANLEGLTLHQATIRPATGGTITAQGTADLDRQALLRPNLNLTAQTDLPLDGLAQLYEVPLPRPIRLGSLIAEAQLTGKPDDPRAMADWQLPQATFPGRGRLVYGDRQLQAQDTQFQVGEGRLQAQAEADLERFDWQATLAGSSLALGLLSPQLRGSLDTQLRAEGNLRTLTPQGIQAHGQLRLSEAIPVTLDGQLAGAETLIPGPLQARFAWTGQRLQILAAIAANLSAQGGADITFPAEGGLPEISDLDLTTRLSNLDLGAVYALLEGPAWLRPRGYIDFDGTLRGSLRELILAGVVGLRQFSVNDLTLFQDVVGPVRASLTQGARVDLRGGSTEIAAVVSPDWRPERFRLTNGDFVAEGQRQGHELVATLRHFDLGALAIRPVNTPALGTVAGLLNAHAQIDLTDWFNPQLSARFAVEQPGWGAIAAQRLSGQLHYRDGLALLTGGILQLTPTTQFLITGNGRLFPEWQARAEVTTDGADFQAILHALNLYGYRDFGRLLTPQPLGRADDLAVTPVGLPQAPLLEQASLARELQDQGALLQTEQAQAWLPSLNQLEGQVAGRLGLSASRREGLAADFDFFGQNWAWGRYDFDNQFVAKGHLRDQTLSLDPVEFRAGDTRLSLLGTVSRQDSDLAVRAENLPLSAASTLLETPFEVNGLLNLTANLTGAYTNPQLTGSLAVDQASLNQQPMQEISSTFGYQDALFTIDGRMVGSAPEPLLFSGTIPYALPFMAVPPPSDQIALRATLKDEALSLVNLFTPLLVWGGGKANIDVQVGGTLSNPQVHGAIAFDQATFTSPLLEASLAQLRGTVLLQGTHIQAQALTGTLFDGTFALTGTLPLIAPEQPAAGQGLKLALEDIQFRLFDEVSSQVNGDLTVTQALLTPTLGGHIHLHNTQVAVGPDLVNLANTVLARTNIAEIRTRLAAATELVPLQVEHLQITLEPARIKALPLFALDAQGTLTLSGPIPGLAADGRIELIDGWVNTVTAEFFLEPGYDNVIRFQPDLKLEPYLDLAWVAAVPLQRNYNINRVGTTTGLAEIPDINLLGSNTVFDELVIQARIKGPAQHLFENLQLTSNPAYSQEQLLGMVSGGYLADLGGTEPTLAIGSNLLTAFSADLQDNLGRTLGLRRLRLTASTLQPTETGDTLGYGVGANVVINRNLSASFVQVLTRTQPIQLNAHYRLNQNWGVRGSTNLSDNSRLFMEYRHSF